MTPSSFDAAAYTTGPSTPPVASVAGRGRSAVVPTTADAEVSSDDRGTVDSDAAVVGWILGTVTGFVD